MIKGPSDPTISSYLLKGTKVSMADGTAVPIEDVKIGDAVLVAAQPPHHDLVSSHVVSTPVKTRLVGFSESCRLRVFHLPVEYD